MDTPTNDAPVTVEETLRWYAENASGCRKIGRDGDVFRQALDADGGKRALAALASAPAESDDRGQVPKHWMPIDTAPRDRQIIHVLVPLKDGGFIEGAAYFDPDAYDGTWWWDGTNKSDYFTDPISECNHGDPLYWLLESDTGEQASSLGFMTDRPVAIAEAASAPAGDGVEPLVAELRNPWEGLPNGLGLKRGECPQWACDLMQRAAAALARARAAVGEREAIAAAQRLKEFAGGAALTQVYGREWCMFPETKMRADLRAILAQQSPPAKVEE